MTHALLAALLGMSVSPLAETDELVVRVGDSTHRLGLVIDTPTGPLAKREAELLRGWKPSADGSDPLDHLLPDGRLLRVELLPPSPHAEPLTRALFGALDADLDSKLSRDELKAAPKVLLAAFDADGDECLTPLEIVPDLLTAEPKGKGFEGKVEVLRRGEPLPAGTSGPLTATVTVRVGKRDRFLSRRPELTFDVLSTGPLPSGEPRAPKSLHQADRHKERLRFEGVAAEVVTLAVRPQARGWFELLDADGDGRLSVRELRSAAERLRMPEVGGGKEFVGSPDFGSPVVSVTVSPGAVTRPAARLVPQSRPVRGPGPTWFVALDRNGDGDVSRAEFIGTDDEFKHYDSDGDGLISAPEAEAGDRKFQQREKL